ncbi:Uncharacterised protein [Candidatus Ornithobacterium hominis]|uniref:Uncharacterized protein n=1 Tax=Candidatus Ornithobacterium hominis TaxID=2497989 RepID=A0A383U3E8_9FLAO|nr:hypothetical protein [Candidatus Ornithobacterium hominis]MCT7904744.1 hypothetical protein [Candidatus Ornithobacterium hominis]CAI9429868.1 Bacteriocin [Candidatus Ornithobacterium hominis]SZD73909.1 Uncharacterised protein [Candidatus Ornithobacterium hominis]
MNTLDLTIEELMTIEGGCDKCEGVGKKIGRFVREVIIDTIEDWFN